MGLERGGKQILCDVKLSEAAYRADSVKFYVFGEGREDNFKNMDKKKQHS